MTMNNYRVIWSAEDQEFVGLVDEFPSLSYLAGNQAAALDGIKNLATEIMFDMLKNCEAFPVTDDGV